MKMKLVVPAALAACLLLPACVPLALTGAAAGALVAGDRRTTGIYIEDESIEWKAIDRIRALGTGAHVNATSYNRRILITGEAPTEDAKKRIEDSLRGIPNVKEVTNEMVVGGVSSLTSRGNDSLITSNVKARLVNNGKVSPHHVKVVTEAGVVYLMGLVSTAEADAAVEITRNTQGVSRVVKVFEYIAA
jgi:osmotically-inducible protein OsmY